MFRFGMISRGLRKHEIEFAGGVILLVSFVLMFVRFGLVSGLLLIATFWIIVTPIVESAIIKIRRRLYENHEAVLGNTKSQSKIVFLVEDEKALVPLLTAKLRSKGYSVVHRDTLGKNLTRDILHHKPSVILLDAILPDGAGLSAAKMIRNTAKLKDTPIYIVLFDVHGIGQPLPGSDLVDGLIRKISDLDAI